MQLYTRKWRWSLILDYYRNDSGFTGVNFFKRFNFNTNSNFINSKFSIPQNCSSITRISYLNSLKNNTKFQFYWNLSVIGFFVWPYVVWWHFAIGNSHIIMLLFADYWFIESLSTSFFLHLIKLNDLTQAVINDKHN